MEFPIAVSTTVNSHNGAFNRIVTLHGGFTVLLGPNGSGKTHLLRGLKTAFGTHSSGKKVMFLSAGRMGLLEQYRSDFDGHRGGNPLYESASFGNKGDAPRRFQMETLNGVFQTLAQRPDILIKIQERLRKLFKRDLIIEWDAGTLKIMFQHLTSSGKPYSSGREASGLMHLVGILTALYDDEVGVLLLDEPEVSLHPQLQAFLLKEILGVAGYPSPEDNKKLVVIATHSTEMFQIKRPEDLLSLVFCYDLNEGPIQISPEAGELKSRKIQGLISRLGQEHKLSLFSRCPLLVEGPSDVMICSAIADKVGLHIEAAGSQLLPVIGKGQMPVVSKLMSLLGKTPVVLADADAIADNLELVNYFVSGNSVADTEASNSGFPSASQMATVIYSDFCKTVEDNWVSIAAVAEKHPYWINMNPGEEVLARRRAAFCALFITSEDVLTNISTDGKWIKLKRRLQALLDLLEKVGLFILRRGSIESYYQRADQLTIIGKPYAAADEMEHIYQLNQVITKDQYSDIVRAVSFACQTEHISEAEALRDLLLAVAAPAQARVKTGAPGLDLDSLSRSLLGERSSIFGLTAQADTLVVSMSSKILNVKGFPMTIKKDDDVVRVVSSSLDSGGET